MLRISYDSWLYRIITFFCEILAAVKWDWLKGLFNNGKYWNLEDGDRDYVRAATSKYYFIILTRRNTHLTTYFISLGNWLVTRRWATYAHALMNVTLAPVATYQEATAKGVHYSNFDKVFDVDAVCLIRPKGFTNEDWKEVVEQAFKNKGLKYDNIFNISDDSRQSCVEFVRDCLREVDDYEVRFARFEALIKKHGNNLTPQMIRDCEDFEVFYEVIR